MGPNAVPGESKLVASNCRALGDTHDRPKHPGLLDLAFVTYTWQFVLEKQLLVQVLVSGCLHPYHYPDTYLEILLDEDLRLGNNHWCFKLKDIQERGGRKSLEDHQAF